MEDQPTTSQYPAPPPNDLPPLPAPGPATEPLPPPKPPRRWLRPLVVIVIIAGLAGLAAAGYLAYQRFVGKEQTAAPPAENAKVRLVAVGDNIPHDTVNQAAKTAEGYDYAPLFDNVKPFFEKADIRFCNQESPSGGAEFGIGGFPTFNAPTEFARDLNKAGCNLISLANNHLGDKGTDALNKTLDTWDSLDTRAVAGANRNAEEQNQVRYFEVKGIKFAFVAFSEFNNNKATPPQAVNQFDPALVSKLLDEARGQADFVIVSAHWGDEDSPAVNMQQELQAKTLADHGADVVIGTGPHVLQPVKKIGGLEGHETLVWFSIGNFLSSQLTVEELIGGFAIMDIEKVDGKAKITAIKFLPTYMHYEWTPEEKKNEDLLKRKNLKLYPLDQAVEVISKSQLNTTVDAQTDRITKILNQNLPVEVIGSGPY